MNYGDALPDSTIHLGGNAFAVVDRVFLGTHVAGRIVGLPYDALGWAEHCDRRKANEARVAAKRPVGPVVGRGASDAGGRGRDVDRPAVSHPSAPVRPADDGGKARAAPGSGDDRTAEGRAGRGEDPPVEMGAEDEEEQPLDLGADEDGTTSADALKARGSEGARVPEHPGAGREPDTVGAKGPSPVESRQDSPAALRTPPQGNAADGRAEERDATPGAIPSTSGANAGSTPAGRAGVRDTSIEAYRAHRASGKMTAQQLVLVTHFEATPGLRATRQELARDLALGINVVCGRVNELLRAEPAVLVERGRKRCAVTGNDVNALELV